MNIDSVYTEQTVVISQPKNGEIVGTIEAINQSSLGDDESIDYEAVPYTESEIILAGKEVLKSELRCKSRKRPNLKKLQKNIPVQWSANPIDDVCELMEYMAKKSPLMNCTQKQALVDYWKIHPEMADESNPKRAAYIALWTDLAIILNANEPWKTWQYWRQAWLVMKNEALWQYYHSIKYGMPVSKVDVSIKELINIKEYEVFLEKLPYKELSAYNEIRHGGLKTYGVQHRTIAKAEKPDNASETGIDSNNGIYSKRLKQLLERQDEIRSKTARAKQEYYTRKAAYCEQQLQISQRLKLVKKMWYKRKMKYLKVKEKFRKWKANTKKFTQIKIK